MLYQYVKENPGENKAPLLSMKKVFSLTSIVAGLFLIIWVAWPIISFRMKFAHLYEKGSKIISPLPGTFTAIAKETQAKTSESLGVTTIDYTKAHNWFPKLPQGEAKALVDSYRVSIPKLRIENALVIVGSDDLEKSLIHYGGTSAPGEYGNAVIFGHSILPHFYNPKDYNTIFSTLPSLIKGDEAFVEYDGVLYTYTVEGMRVTDPEDVSGLEQRYDSSYITLVTCVPPGTYFKRLWVTARIKNN